MYILKEKETGNLIIVAEKIKVADLLNIHRNTVTNRIKEGKVIENEKYLLIIPFKYYPPTKNKGNRDKIHLKRAKAEGIEECKTKKKR